MFIVGWILYEAIQRFITPQEVLGQTMLIVATAGLVVNIVSFTVLHGGDRDNLNIRGAALHVAGDLLGSVAAIVAAVIIIYTGWMQIDPILSIDTDRSGLRGRLAALMTWISRGHRRAGGCGS